MSWKAVLLTLLLVAVVLSCPPNTPSGAVKWNTAWNVAGASVNIPAGNSVILDTSPGVALGLITVNGSLFIFDTNLEIITQGILVGSQGTLTIGTSDCPITQKVIITLTAGAQFGVDSYDDTQLGTKGIVAVWGGVVQMYGYTAGPSWTRLASTAQNGSTTLVLQEPVQWRSNDVILIASTDFSEVTASGSMSGGSVFADQHEKRTIASISPDGKTIQLNAPLSWKHWGQGIESAEVGLLTRRILLRGDDSSDSNQQGGHLLIRHGAHYIQGVELTKMGQRSVMGRYPIHVHVARFLWGLDVTLTDNSIHDVYQRCIAIHESHGVNVFNNIAYNTSGHCYFLEDGGEHGNVFRKNWGAYTRSMDVNPLLPSDNQASTFWISNPNNTFTDNVASGAFIGFWFAMPAMPVRTGAKFWTDPTVMNPRRTCLPPDGFLRNVIHGIYQDGVQCSEMENTDGTMSAGQWDPTSGAPFLDSMKIPLVLSQITIYKTRGTGVWSRGCSPSTWRDLIIADTPRGTDMIGYQTMINNTYIGNSDNVGFPNTRDGRFSVANRDGNFNSVGGIFHYDVGNGQAVVNCTFINFTDPNANFGAWGGSTNGPGWDSPPGYLSLNSTIINSNPVAFPLWFGTNTFQADGIFDDGTLTGVKGGAQMVGLMPGFQDVPECTYKDQYPGYLCSPFMYGFSHMTVSGPPTSLWIPEAADRTIYKMKYVGGKGVTHLFSQDAIGFIPMGKTMTDVAFVQTTQSNWYVYIATLNTGLYEIISYNTSGVLFQNFGQFSITWGQATKQSSWNIYSVDYPSGTTFQIGNTIEGANPTTFTQVTNFMDLNWNTYYVDSKTNKLYFMMMSDPLLPAPELVGSPGYEWHQATNWHAQTLTVTASCGNNCKRTGVATVASVPSSLPTSVLHDVYKAVMTGPIASGTFFFQVYPFYKNSAPRLAYQLWHDLKGTPADWNFCIAVNGKCISTLFVDELLGTSFTIILSRRVWNALVAGGAQVIVSSPNGVRLMTGNIVLMNQAKKVWAPSESAPSLQCSPAYPTLVVYNGSTTFSVYADAPASIMLNDTVNPLCDGKSLSYNASTNSFGFTDMALHVPSQYVSLEFFLRSNTMISTALGLYVQQYPGSSYNPSPTLDQYNANYFLDNNWNFYRVPLSVFNTNNTFHRLTFALVQQGWQNTINISFSQIRFSTVPATVYTAIPQQIAYTYSDVVNNAPAHSNVVSPLISKGVSVRVDVLFIFFALIATALCF